MTGLSGLRLLAVGLGIMALSACGPDTSEIATLTGAKAVVAAAVAPITKRNAPKANNQMTRAKLANILTPVDLVTIETTGAQGVIAKIGTNRGVETWSSVDNKTLAMRNGIIIATRGLGADLISAAAPQAIAAGQTYQRSHVVLDGADQPVTSRFSCHMTAGAAETIVVVERSYATRRITERCSGDSGAFVNDYWVETSGKLRKSRQLISKDIGFVVIEHLI